MLKVTIQLERYLEIERVDSPIAKREMEITMLVNSAKELGDLAEDCGKYFLNRTNEKNL